MEDARAIFLQEVEDDVRRFTERDDKAGTGFAGRFRDFVVSAYGIRRAVRNWGSPREGAERFYDEIRFLNKLGLPYPELFYT